MPRACRASSSAGGQRRLAALPSSAQPRSRPYPRRSRVQQAMPSCMPRILRRRWAAAPRRSAEQRATAQQALSQAQPRAAGHAIMHAAHHQVPVGRGASPLCRAARNRAGSRPASGAAVCSRPCHHACRASSSAGGPRCLAALPSSAQPRRQPPRARRSRVQQAMPSRMPRIIKCLSAAVPRRSAEQRATATAAALSQA